MDQIIDLTAMRQVQKRQMLLSNETVNAMAGKYKELQGEANTLPSTKDTLEMELEGIINYAGQNGAPQMDMLKNFCFTKLASVPKMNRRQRRFVQEEMETLLQIHKETWCEEWCHFK